MKEKIKILVIWLESQPIENWRNINGVVRITINEYKIVISGSLLNIVNNNESQDFRDPLINNLYLTLQKRINSTDEQKKEKFLDNLIAKL